MFSAAVRRLSAGALFVCVMLPFAPVPAFSAVTASPAALAAATRGAGELVQPARVRRERRMARRPTFRRRTAVRVRRPRGSSNPVYSNIRPNATLPQSIMVPELGVPRTPPPAVQVAPARVLGPVRAGARPTIVPQAVTPNPETFSDRVVRCTHAAGVNGVSPGHQGLYISSCAN